MLGDFYINTLSNSQEFKGLQDCIQSYDIKDLLGHVPTRITESSSSSIDNVMTNYENVVSAQTVNGHISDHLGQLLVIGCLDKLKQNKKYENRRLFSEYNITLVKKTLGQESWESVYRERGVDSKWEVFVNILTRHIDITIPAKKINVNKNKPPVVKCVKLDEKVKRLQEGMEYMYKLHRETSLDLYKEAFKKYKFEYHKEVRRRKVEHISKQTRNSDCVSKSCWAVVNDMRNTDSKTKINNIELSIHNGTFSDPYIVSNIFNDYFIDAIENDTCIKQERQFKYDKEKERDSCKLATVTIKDITQLIDSLKNKRSAGLDEFSPFLMKKCKGELARLLVHLINCVIEEEILIEHYNMNNSIGDFQHGFRSGQSTISAAVQFVHCLMEKINEGYKTGGVLLDLSKAFDGVHHGVLLSKLACNGVSGKLLLLIESYLKDRQQCTEVVCDNGEVIKKKKIKDKKYKFWCAMRLYLGPLLVYLLRE
ncbi:uncharacterized protein LOC124606537 [Schistocerca americana]|uniref:uncharacterized protein LOC124606537 n=1 Tax=Schistocerca americana TaxID=7009 RepID=UPI001F4F5676|nr:uncharacterized protein LOC124606537 [Schistocerca americana]